MATKKIFSAEDIIMAAFAVAGVIMLTISVILSTLVIRAGAREKTAPGKVVDMVIRRERTSEELASKTEEGNEYYYPTVEFTLPDGTRHTVQMPEGSWPAAYEKGEAVTVRYDPGKPTNARIKSTSSAIGRWMGPAFLGFFGLCFTIAAGWAYWVLRLKPSSA